jgi:hypothetical protein
MKKLISKLKPESGATVTIHILMNLLLAAGLLILVNLNLDIVAIFLVLLSKWRMFAVKPRYWISNLRANAVDLIIGLSVVSFISTTQMIYYQIIWAVLYMVWLVWLKPKSKPTLVMAQALIAQALGLVAFFRAFPDNSLIVSIIVVWLISYSVARHFLGAFDEPLVGLISDIWAWFGASMAWILGHWEIDYIFLPQIAIILTVLGYGLATIYYLHKNEKLKASFYRQLMFVMGLILLIIIVFSDWQDKTI